MASLFIAEAIYITPINGKEEEEAHYSIFSRDQREYPSNIPPPFLYPHPSQQCSNVFSPLLLLFLQSAVSVSLSLKEIGLILTLLKYHHSPLLLSKVVVAVGAREKRKKATNFVKKKFFVPAFLL